MRVIPGVEITEALLTYTNVAEPSAGETVWSNSTNYKAGDRVINTTTHRTYRSLIGTEAVVTISIATPGVVTWVNHGLAASTPIIFSTTGTLPTGITAGTTYYVIADTVNSFKLSATIGGSTIATSGTQSGVHTALADPNRAHDPTTDDGTRWTDVGPTNKWAMFDTTTTAPTEVASPLIVELTLGQRADSLGLSGLVADEAFIEAIFDSVVIKTWTLPLLYRSVASWYEHLVTPFRFRSKTALWDIPAESSLTIRLTLTRAVGNVKCGFAIPGRQIYLGDTRAGAEPGGKSYYRATTDDDGNTKITPGAVKKTTKQTVMFEKVRAPIIDDARRDLSGKIAFWSAVDDATDDFFEPMQVVGFYEDMTPSLAPEAPDYGLLSLTVREL